MDQPLIESALPDNPKAKVYLNVCFVCRAPSKPGSYHLRNYGAVVCFSCRAFWRRCYQNATVSPTFVCRKERACTIRATTRKNCKKCRHDRCLKAGMNPAAVLSDDQKKERFKKLLKRKQKILDREAKMKKFRSNQLEAAAGSTSSNPNQNQRPRRQLVKSSPTASLKIDINAIEKEFSLAQQETRYKYIFEE